MNIMDLLYISISEHGGYPGIQTALRSISISIKLDGDGGPRLV